MKKTEESLHIPCGFRCHTKRKMLAKNNIQKRETFPFDNGFWSPYSIKKILDSKYIHINLKNTVPCIKTDPYMDNKKRD